MKRLLYIPIYIIVLMAFSIIPLLNDISIKFSQKIAIIQDNINMSIIKTKNINSFNL